MRLLILNSSIDTCDMLEEYFRRDGWETAILALKAVREGTVTGKDLITMYQPDAILFDVAIPYDTNWSALQLLRNNPDVTCPIIVTTTNESAVRRMAGIEERVQEIVGKPYDLDRLQDAIVTALARIDLPRFAPKADRRAGERRVRERRMRSNRSGQERSNAGPSQP
jgi:DNA-binding response OmpR family regulator